jgi:hypothetical protein
VSTSQAESIIPDMPAPDYKIVVPEQALDDVTQEREQ